MQQFSLALIAFVLLHIGVAGTGLRGALVSRLGERGFRGLFSLASIAALVWLIWSFNAVRGNPFDLLNQALWAPPAWARHVAQTLVLLGLLLGVSGLLTPNPTAVGFEGVLKREEPAKGVLRITRHPFLWGVTLWAAGHLLANGERFAPMLFGGLGLMALLGTRSIDRKRAASSGEDWARFAAVTSNVPFAAILQGRNRLVLGEVWLRAAAALAVFAAAAWAHGAIFQHPVFP